MPKTIKLEPHLGSKELEDRYRQAKDPLERSHYQIVWLISEGRTTRQVMELTGYSRGWIQKLAGRYNSDGPEALGDRRHQNPGARERALLSAEQRQELAEALRKPPEDGGMWNSPKVGEWIEEKTGKAVASKKQRGWEHLRRLGNSPKVPRPCHAAKADEREQRRLLKKAPDEGDEAQGGLPDGEGGVVVRGRAPPPGPQAHLTQGMVARGRESAGEGPPERYEWTETSTPSPARRPGRFSG